MLMYCMHIACTYVPLIWCLYVPNKPCLLDLVYAVGNNVESELVMVSIRSRLETVCVPNP